MNRTSYTCQTTGAPIYTSRTIRRVPVGRNDYLMSYGDRISVRIVKEERPLMEYETRQVADMTDLTGDLRRRASQTQGLVVAYIRNHDRGWTREQRLMLYPQRKFIPRRKENVVKAPVFYPWDL